MNLSKMCDAWHFSIVERAEIEELEHDGIYDTFDSSSKWSTRRESIEIPRIFSFFFFLIPLSLDRTIYPTFVT